MDANALFKNFHRSAAQAFSNINLNEAANHLNNIKNVIEKKAIEPTLRTFSDADKTIDHIKRTISNSLGQEMAIGRLKDLFGNIASVDLERSIRDFPIESSMNKAVDHLKDLHEKTSSMNTLSVGLDINRATGQIKESLDGMFDKVINLCLGGDAHRERRELLKSLIDKMISSIIQVIRDHPELIYATAALGIGLLMAPVALPLAASAAGFGSGGVVAGSAAAGFMASYGGSISAGSICAILQSIGATGAIGSAANIGFIVAGLSAVISAILMDHISRREKDK